jgi:DNA repair protein RecO (recombination protein O)
MIHSYRVEAVVLKRRDYAEADRIVTLFTKEVGKLVVLAKSVRKMTSKRVSSLEPGTLIDALIIPSKGMDLLSQTVIKSSHGNLKQDLVAITQLSLLLEVVDLLTRENQELPEVYQILVDTLASLTHTTDRKPILLEAFNQIASHLGFTPPDHMTETALKTYIETIAERDLHSKAFLMPDKMDKPYQD